MDGEHRLGARETSSPVARAHPDRTAVAHQHARDAHAAFEPAAVLAQALDERRGQLPGAALGHREAVLLAEAAEHPAEQAAAGGVGRQVGVQRVAGQQPGGAVAAKALLGQAPHR